MQGGWSRNVLVHQIERNLFDRQGHTLTNFDKTLPAPQPDLPMGADANVIDVMIADDPFTRANPRSIVRFLPPTITLSL